MTRTQAEAEIEKIAIRGAKAALKELGLSDDNASSDVKSLREMLSDWRELKKSIFKTFAKWISIIAFGYLVVKFDLMQYVKVGK